MNCEQENTETPASEASGETEVANELTPIVNEPNQVATSSEAKEEFGYLQRDEFTSEIYKIELRGLGYFGVGELKKLLKQKLKLDANKVKSPNRNKDFAFVCFRTAKDYNRALQVLDGYKWKGKLLNASAAKASPDPLVLKRRQMKNAADDDGNASDAADDNNIPKKKTKVQTIQAADMYSVCPLAKVPYDEQLAEKLTQMKLLLTKFIKDVSHVNGSLKEHLEKFEFKGLSRATKVNGYRNKNEFSIGRNQAGEIVVGFRAGSYTNGSIEVCEVSPNSVCLLNIPEAAKWAASSFQKFVRTSDLKLEPFSPETNGGHYKQLMVRTSEHTGEIMIVVGMYSTNLTDEALGELKKRLKAYYMDGSASEGSEFRCTSLYYQDVKKAQSGQKSVPVEHLAGTTHITDEILKLKFRISPLAFFQVNTPGANVLYEHAIELAAPKANSVVLDICCGTGTIGLAFAKHARLVLGVDIVADAIEDAKLNAEANNIENVRFYAGNADDFVSSMVREAIYDCATDEQLDLIAIVDPPRNGLHSRSITAIRAASDIRRLVYVSCNASRAQNNWIDLCRPVSKKYKGEPFYPKSAVGVDMFPHTLHTELIMLFER